MTTHESIAIRFEALFDRIVADTDEKWWRLLDHRYDELTQVERQAIDAGKDGGDDSAAWCDYDDADNRAFEELKGSWFVVSWPQHVTSPRFNSDASYSVYTGADAERRARNDADKVFANL